METHPRRPLLERDFAQNLVKRALLRAHDGAGITALIAGEAGVGKTSLLRWLDEAFRKDFHIVWGNCEALHAARPLGPLLDIAGELGLTVRDAAGAMRPSLDLFDALHEALRASKRPTILIFEDVHWADQSTLDLIRFLSRRIARLRAALVISFRADEVVADHPLRSVLGDLPADAVVRVPVQALSREAIGALAKGSQFDSDTLYEITAGNPFFVTEALATGDVSVIPVTVRDAVQARMARLPAAQMEVLNAVSVIPGRAEKWLLREMLQRPDESDIAECVFRGVLVEADNTKAVQFRHELARRACEANLAPALRRALHTKALAALSAHAASNSARLVHHAHATGDHATILLHAQTAAREAAQLGAHREAAAHLKIALEAIAAGADAEPSVVAQCYESWSYEAGLVKITEETLVARNTAITLWQKIGDKEKVALNCRWAARLHWYRGESARSQAFANRAIVELADAAPCAEQAWGYSVVSQHAMLNGDTTKAIEYGERAIALAEQVGATEVRVHALNNIGSAQAFANDLSGLKKLEESLALALKHGFHEQAARVYTNMASYGVSCRDLQLARRFANDGLEFDRRHDLDSWTYYLEGVSAQIELLASQFPAAESIALEALSHDGLTSVMRLPSLSVLMYVYLRTGHRDAERVFDEANAIALATGELQRTWPVQVARAETAWLAGNDEGVLAAIDAILAHPNHDHNPWDFGEAIIWKHRAGHSQIAVATKVSKPFALEIMGDLEGAAQAWHRIGDPYSEALVLAHGDAPQRVRAIEIFDEIGGAPAAHKLREWAREAGVKGVPRGPYKSRKESEFGITAKEREVLHLLVRGKTNSQISDELFRSAKTVEHHVSSLLSKLNAKNRTDAAKIAQDMRLLDQEAA
jgi:DNA-binding CsgD family transcriptional regulator/tetratricopeptide (TPR) repeat protein